MNKNQTNKRKKQRETKQNARTDRYKLQRKQIQIYRSTKTKCTDITNKVTNKDKTEGFRFANHNKRKTNKKMNRTYGTNKQRLEDGSKSHG